MHRLRTWSWKEPKHYNGFTPVQRIRGWQLNWWLIDNGWRSPATVCSITGATKNVVYHGEDYYRPWTSYPVSKSAHFHIHHRFKNTSRWTRFVNEHADTGTEWFCLLSTDEETTLVKGVDQFSVFSKEAPIPCNMKIPWERFYGVGVEDKL